MISRFINKFRRNDSDEQRAFQAHVLGLLKEMFPDRQFEMDADPLTITSGKMVMGLTNLRANFLATNQTDSDLIDLISDSIGVVLGSDVVENNELDWEFAKGRLLPQLMPAEYLEKMTLVFRSFGDNVMIGYVVDSERSYSYVREEDIKRWGVGPDELHDIALENLELNSEDLQANFVPGDNGLVAIAGADGFDASRILLSGLREKIAESLGVDDFFFGIPNRDFLICWSSKGDAEFQNSMRTQIATDVERQPYPLSGKTFIVKADGEIFLEEQSSIGDPRAETAELN